VLRRFGSATPAASLQETADAYGLAGLLARRIESAASHKSVNGGQGVSIGKA
jgi:hypothetical protein